MGFPSLSRDHVAATTSLSSNVVEDATVSS